MKKILTFGLVASFAIAAYAIAQTENSQNKVAPPPTPQKLENVHKESTSSNSRPHIAASAPNAGLLAKVPNSSRPSTSRGKAAYTLCTESNTADSARYYEGVLKNKNWVTPPTECATSECFKKLKDAGSYILTFEVSESVKPLGILVKGKKTDIDTENYLQIGNRYRFCASLNQKLLNQGTVSLNANKFYPIEE